MIYIVGNPEFYGNSAPALFNELLCAFECSNVCVLESESIQVDGWKFLGCTFWTDFQLCHDPAAAMLVAQSKISDFSAIRGRADWFSPDAVIVI